LPFHAGLVARTAHLVRATRKLMESRWRKHSTKLFDSGPKGITLPSSSANVFQVAAYDAPSGEGNGSGLILSLLDNNGGSLPLYNLEH
jgi:hypothetical protein